MMHPVSAEAVRLSGREGLLAAVPALLGFHPADSICLLCLTGPRRRIGPIVRVDLPTHPSGQVPPSLVETLARTAAQHADEAALILYTDRPDTVQLDTLCDAIGAVCPILDVVTAPNKAQPIPDELLVATITSGRAVLGSRQELARSVEHRPGTTTPALLAELDSVAGRDALISRLLPEPDAVADLVAAAQATPDDDPRTADLCAALAVLAYRHGNGALAQVAADRALRTALDHRLAHLMLAVMAAGLPPAALDDLTH